MILFNSEQEYQLPPDLLNDSLMISDLINDCSDLPDILRIEVNFSLTSLGSYSPECTDQQILPILSFLNCQKILIRISLNILNQYQQLIEFTKNLWYHYPNLAYQGLMRGVMKLDELPKYNSEVEITEKEWKNLVGEDPQVAISLLNLRVPPHLILTKNFNCNYVIINDNNEAISGQDFAVGVIKGVINGQIIDEVLMDLFNYTPSPYIIQRLIQAKNISTLMNLDKERIPTYTTNYYLWIIETRDLEMITAMMKIFTNQELWNRNSLYAAMTSNYLEPLHLINCDELTRLSIQQEIIISVEGFNQVMKILVNFSNYEQLIDDLVNILITYDRDDLIQVILSEHQVTNPIIPHLKSEAEYVKIFNKNFEISTETILHIRRSRYCAPWIMDVLVSINDQELADILLMISTYYQVERITVSQLIFDNSRILSSIRCIHILEYLSSRLDPQTAFEHRKEHLKLATKTMIDGVDISIIGEITGDDEISQLLAPYAKKLKEIMSV